MTMPLGEEERYPAFGKIPRLNRDVIVTEKIDGTNALISIREIEGSVRPRDHEFVVLEGGQYYALSFGSRSRWLTMANDNHGFALWGSVHREELVKLGEGRHYGEWYGEGIQRGYGLDEKRFMLFNTARWTDDALRPECCEVSTVLFEGNFKDLYTAGLTTKFGGYRVDQRMEDILDDLRAGGSYHVPGYDRPEGVVIYHKAANQLFKILLENDESPKGN